MPRQERERRYIAEYMLDTLPEGEYQINVELGPIPQEYVQRHGMARAAAMFRPTRPRVDAVKWTPEAYYLVEAKIRDIKAGIGDLAYYKVQAELAPDLPFYDGQPIVLRLIVPWMLEWLQLAADAQEIEVVVFCPDWIEEYVEERKHYHTAEYRQQRAELMENRRILGLE